jgi:hypothetical protein
MRSISETLPATRQWRTGARLVLASLLLVLPPFEAALAHHVLGRPSYSLSEDSNTPPSIQAEVLVGDYMVTYMVYPAFPQPGEPGRISLYAIRADDATTFEGEVTFKVRDSPWYSWLGIEAPVKTIGTQRLDDKVFRQAFLFHEPGEYIITAAFEAAGEPYRVDFPLRIGEPSMLGPIGAVVALLLIALVGAAILHRRRALTDKVRAIRQDRE